LAIKLEDVFQYYGNPIQEDKTSDDFEIFSYTQTLKYIREEIIQSIILKNKNLNIQIFVVNNFEVNAHAIKLDTNEYVIIIKSGLIKFAMETCGYEIDFLKKELKSLGDQNDIMAFYIYFTVLYFSGHEFGHIINGHLEFSKNDYTIDEKSLLDISNINELPEDLKSNPDIFRHLLELNADKLSIIFLAQGVLNLLIKFQKDLNKNTLNELVKLVVYNIYLTHYKFGFFDNKSKNYPSHFFRAYTIIHNFPKVLTPLFKEKIHADINNITNLACNEMFDYLSDNDESFMHDNHEKDIIEISNLYTKEHNSFINFLKKHTIL
jgi:hypothetical protein